MQAVDCRCYEFAGGSLHPGVLRLFNKENGCEVSIVRDPCYPFSRPTGIDVATLYGNRAFGPHSDAPAIEPPLHETLTISHSTACTQGLTCSVFVGSDIGRMHDMLNSDPLCFARFNLVIEA